MFLSEYCSQTITVIVMIIIIVFLVELFSVFSEEFRGASVIFAKRATTML